MPDIRKEWVDILPNPNGEWLKIHLKNNKLYLQYKFSRTRNEDVKNIGFTWRKNSGWYGSVSKMLIRNFITLFPQSKEIIRETFPDWCSFKNYDESWVPSSYLMPHQLESAILAKEHPRFGFFHDTGTGKSLLGVELHKQKKVNTLVTCPLSIIEDAWGEDITEFAPEIPYCNLHSIVRETSKKRKAYKINKMIDDKCSLFIINYESFWRNLEFINELGIEMMLLDESSFLKSHKTKVTKKVITFVDNIDYCYLFSATPAPNLEAEYWAQCRLIDPTVFGASYYAFKGTYFFEVGYGGFKLKMKDDMREKFLDKLSTISEVILKKDVIEDLPEQTFNIREVTLSTAERKAYDEMERHLIIEVDGHEVVAGNQAAKRMKLREGTSGFFYTEDMTDRIGQDGLFIIERNVVKTGDSKLKELEVLLDEIGNNKVIIWTHFHYEADSVENMLREKGKLAVRVDGSVRDGDERSDRLRQFKEGSAQYLIAHPQSIGHGQRLFMSNYAVYFSMTDSYEMFKQSKDRQHRKKQKFACTYYFLIAKGTVDRAIYRAVREKRSVTKATFDYIQTRKEELYGKEEGREDSQ